VISVLAAATALVVTILAARFLHGPPILPPALLLAGFILYGSLDATCHRFSTRVTMVALLSVWRIVSLKPKVRLPGPRSRPILPGRIDGKSCLYSRPFRSYRSHHYQLTNVFATGDEVCQTGDSAVPLGGRVGRDRSVRPDALGSRGRFAESQRQSKRAPPRSLCGAMSTGTRSSVCAFACCFSVGGLRWNVRGLRRARENRCRLL
jgi:hypothetical protein